MKEKPRMVKFCFFLLETLKTACENQPINGRNQGIFSQHWGTFFQFLKKGKEDFPPPSSSYVPVCMI